MFLIVLSTIKTTFELGIGLIWPSYPWNTCTQLPSDFGQFSDVLRLGHLRLPAVAECPISCFRTFRNTQACGFSLDLAVDN